MLHKCTVCDCLMIECGRKRHVAIQHGEQVFSTMLCSICGQKYYDQQHFDDHIGVENSSCAIGAKYQIVPLIDCVTSGFDSLVSQMTPTLDNFDSSIQAQQQQIANNTGPPMAPQQPMNQQANVHRQKEIELIDLTGEDDDDEESIIPRMEAKENESIIIKDEQSDKTTTKKKKKQGGVASSSVTIAKAKRSVPKAMMKSATPNVRASYRRVNPVAKKPFKEIQTVERERKRSQAQRGIMAMDDWKGDIPYNYKFGENPVKLRQRILFPTNAYPFVVADKNRGATIQLEETPIAQLSIADLKRRCYHDVEKLMVNQRFQCRLCSQNITQRKGKKLPYQQSVRLFDHVIHDHCRFEFRCIICKIYSTTSHNGLLTHSRSHKEFNRNSFVDILVGREEFIYGKYMECFHPEERQMDGGEGTSGWVRSEEPSGSDPSVIVCSQCNNGRTYDNQSSYEKHVKISHGTHGTKK